VSERQPISYESPDVRAERRSYRHRWYLLLAGQLLVAFAVIIGSVVLCAIGGGIIGKVIATLFPNYYPGVFHVSTTQPDFDAVEVGIGTGVGQGAAAGVFVGLVIVLALAIANWRRMRPKI
jgi:hypothetical protein